ncbi:hypothetical protein IV102_06485 [bacterium]|nr:hypothetical protein [bacterium]
MKRLLPLLVLLALPAAAATPTLTQAQQVGPIRLGLAESKLGPLLGKWTSETKPHMEMATGMTVKVRSYNKQGLKMTLAQDGPKSPWLVARFTALAPCNWKTPQGIGIGTTAEQVRTAYQPLLDKEMTSAEQIVVGTVYDGVIFSIKQGKVSSIFVGAAAE